MTTPNTGIPYVPENVLDPASGINLALNHIDALLQTAVISMDLTAPPGGLTDGDLYIVATPATGAWAGHENDLARYVAEGTFWQFFAAGIAVHLILNLDDLGLYKFSGDSPGGWTLAAGLGDAPSDGVTYGRKDAAWEPVAAPLTLQDTDSPPSVVVSDAEVIVVAEGLTLVEVAPGVARLTADANPLTVRDLDSPPTVEVTPTSVIVVGDNMTLTEVSAGVARLDAAAGGGGGGGMTLIGSVVAGGAVADLSVASIPNTFDHLLIIYNGRGDAAGVTNIDVRMQFNGDTGANYNYQQAHFVNTASAISEVIGAAFILFENGTPAALATAGRSSVAQGMVPNYANTTFQKLITNTASSSVGNAAFTTIADVNGGTWLNTAAINAVRIFPASGNFVAGSALWVYGF